MLVTAAVSYHPSTATAVGEAVGQVLETIGTHPDLVVWFATPEHAPAAGAVAQAVDKLLSPTALVGGISTGVVANGLAQAAGPTFALWAANVGPIGTFAWNRADGWPTPGGLAGASDWLAGRSGPRNVLMLADGPVSPEGLSAGLEGCEVFGGALARPARSAESGGGLGVAFGAGLGVRTHVVAGTVPVGPPMVVTDASGHRVEELDGAPARNRLLDIALDAVAVEDLGLLTTSLYACDVGEGRLQRVVAMDRLDRSVTLAGTVVPGATVRFFLPASSAEVAAETARVLARAPEGSGALVFPAAGRLRALAPAADDAPELPGVADEGPAVVGCACAPPLTVTNGVVAGHPLGVVVALLSPSSQSLGEHLPFGQGDTR